MTRNERILKLSRAIKAYRGVFHPVSKKWLRPPQKDKRLNIVAWLQKLHRPDIDGDLVAIDGFKSFAEFHEWLGKL